VSSQAGLKRYRIPSAAPGTNYVPMILLLLVCYYTDSNKRPVFSRNSNLPVTHPPLLHPLHVSLYRYIAHSLSSYPAIDGGRFNCPPRNTEGVLFDVSAQMILCAAARGNELIVGTADHALYSLDVTSAGTVAEGGRGGKKPVTTMYPKRGGHREWVTDVGFLADGRVASVGMDGLMCVWDKSRIACQDIEAHRGSVSCLVTGGNRCPDMRSQTLAPGIHLSHPSVCTLTPPPLRGLPPQYTIHNSRCTAYRRARKPGNYGWVR